MYIEKDDQPPAKGFILSVFNTIIHMMIAINLFIIWSFAMSFTFAPEFLCHIIFSGTGYQFLMMEAIMIHNKSNSWSNLLSREHKRIVHLILQIIGTLFIIVGFSLIVSISQLHFQSAHGICGLIGFVCTLISTINGAVTYFVPKVATIRPTIMKALHTLCGCVTIIMGIVTLCIGLNKLPFILIMTKGVSVCATIFAALTLFYVLIIPFVNFGGHIKNMKTTTL